MHSPTVDTLRHLFADVLAAPRRNPVVESTVAQGKIKVGADDDFFALGGDSLGSSQLVVRLREHCGLRIEPRHIFEAPTPARLAHVLEEHVLEKHVLEEGRQSKQSGWPEPVRQPRPLPLAPPQRRLWYLDQLNRSGKDSSGNTGDSSYNLTVAVRFDKPLNKAALARSLNEIAARHEALRTRFEVDATGQPRQVADPPRPVPLHDMDWRALSPEEGERSALEKGGELLRRPFDLSRDLMIRAAILRVAPAGPTQPDDERLMVMFHHIASDGWSIGVFLTELAALYRALPLPPLKLQYADLTTWQEEVLADGRRQELFTYWRERLADAPASLELPADRPRPASPTGRGGVQRFVLGSSRVVALKALGERTRTTLFMILTAVFDTLLYRLSGQGDLLLSVPSANRLHSASEPLIGYFTNMLVLRLRLTSGESFEELLERTREDCLSDFDHQDLPFDDLVDALGHTPEGRGGRMPLVQVGFALQNAFHIQAHRGGNQSTGLRMEPFPVSTDIAHFDLSLSMMEEAFGLEGEFEHSLELFDATTVRRWAESLGVLVDGLLAEPNTRLDVLPLLSQRARHQLTLEWSATLSPTQPESLLQDRVREWALRTPDAVAVRFDVQVLTYGELVGRAFALAHRLRAHGIAPGDAVGVCLERCTALPVAFLGVLEAGAICVPLDPDLPADRRADMVNQTRAVLVLTNQVLTSSDFKGLSTLDPLQADSQPSPQIGPDDVAWVVFTSGSTGRPKGVQMHHRGLCHRMAWQLEAYPLTPGDAVLQNLSIGFDSSIWEYFGPLWAGGEVVLPRPGAHMDTAELAALVARQRVTYAEFVPSVLAYFLEEPEVTACRSLRRVVSGGEVLTRLMAWRFYERLPLAQLAQIYGPTETSLSITSGSYSAQDLGEGPEAARMPVPVGRPIHNLQMYLLDRQGMPVPCGIAGEVYAGGVGITRGYAGRPALTAERYLPDPFKAGRRSSSGRLYRTGDLARFRADGELMFLGRVDQQVKIRGVRMELGEIEARVSALEGISEAAVLARTDVPGMAVEKRLVAYVSPAQAPQAPALRSAGELRRELAKTLPPAMVPGVWVVLERLPHLVSGKIDRKRLPAPVIQDAGQTRVEPRDALEEELAQVWSDVLGVEEISVTDHFFDLGGHSLLAVRLVSEIEQRITTLRGGTNRLDLAGLYAAGTVEGVARRLRQTASEAPEAASDALVVLAEGEGPPLYCVHAVDGTVHAYGPLAQALAGIPVHGLAAPELGDAADNAESIEDLAALQVARLEAQGQLEGDNSPWWLCGWSAGGLIASEIARLLEDRGHCVAGVILLDTHPPSTLDSGPVLDERMLDEAVSDKNMLATARRIQKIMSRALHEDPPVAHGCPVLLVRASDRAAEATLQVEACRALTHGAFDVVMVDGSHVDLLRFPVAREVARIIAQARQGQGILQDP